MSMCVILQHYQVFTLAPANRVHDSCMTRYHQLQKREAEALCQFRVDVPVSTDLLSVRLSQMVEWCSANVEPDQWAHYSHVEQNHGEAPHAFARFYFMSEADADLFWRRWCIHQ